MLVTGRAISCFPLLFIRNYSKQISYFFPVSAK